MKDNLEFRKKCQTCLNQARSLIKKGSYDKLDELQKYIIKSMNEWEEQRKTAISKVQMLRSLVVILEREAKMKKKSGGSNG
jgi:hypothetical protein